jgi:hypothetical protein
MFDSPHQGRFQEEEHEIIDSPPQTSATKTPTATDLPRTGKGRPRRGALERTSGRSKRGRGRDGSESDSESSGQNSDESSDGGRGGMRRLDEDSDFGQMCVCARVCMYVNVCMYEHVCVCAFVYIYIYIYIYIYWVTA